MKYAPQGPPPIFRTGWFRKRVRHTLPRGRMSGLSKAMVMQLRKMKTSTTWSNILCEISRWQAPRNLWEMGRVSLGTVVVSGHPAGEAREMRPARAGALTCSAGRRYIGTSPCDRHTTRACTSPKSSSVGCHRSVQRGGQTRHSIVTPAGGVTVKQPKENHPYIKTKKVLKLMRWCKP